MLILVIDGYDLAMVGAALLAIMDDMGVDATSAGIMAESALLGTMLGAMFLGTLADRPRAFPGRCPVSDLQCSWTRRHIWDW